jgi:hypothetical protein
MLPFRPPFRCLTADGGRCELKRADGQLREGLTAVRDHAKGSLAASSCQRYSIRWAADRAMARPCRRAMRLSAMSIPADTPDEVTISPSSTQRAWRCQWTFGPAPVPNPTPICWTWRVGHPANLCVPTGLRRCRRWQWWWPNRGPIDMLFVEIPRQQAVNAISCTRTSDPGCFCIIDIIDDVQAISHAMASLHQPAGWRALAKKY